MTSKLKQDSQRELTTNKIIECVDNIKLKLKLFSQKELQQELKKLKCPYYHRAGGFLNKLSVIEQVDYSIYKFTNKDITKNELYEVLKKYRSNHNKQCQNFRDKKLTKSQLINLNSIDFDTACKIVRSFGYKIIKEI